MRLNEWIHKEVAQVLSDFLAKETQDSVQNQQLIKLSVITQFFPPDYAATGQLIEELMRHLGSLGVEIEVFTSQPGYAFQSSSAPAVEQLGKVRIQRSRTARLWPTQIRGKAINGLLYTFRAALHLLRARGRFNVLLVTTAPPFLPLLGYLAHLVFSTPYVCILYDLYPEVAIALGVIPKRH